MLKHEFTWTGEVKEWYLGSFPVVMLIQIGVFFAFGLYRGIWRAMGIGDLIRIGSAVGTSVALSYIAAVVSTPPGSAIYSFFFIDFLLLGTLVIGTRSGYRILNYLQQREQVNGRGALIYGAGHGGQRVLRELFQNTALKLWPIGFIDDEPTLWDRTVNRVPVLGSGNDLTSLLENRGVSALIVSSDKINGDRLYKVIRLCRERQIAVLRCSLHMEPLADGDASSVGDVQFGAYRSKG